jgi:hypothetical protein
MWEFDMVKSGIATEPPRAVSSALAKFRLAGADFNDHNLV